MKKLFSSCLGVMLLCGSMAQAADLEVDKSRSRIQVDARATTHSFTGTLEDYTVRAAGDASTNAATSLSLAWDFNDLKTGDVKRDEAMIAWLGGGKPKGSFKLIKSWMEPEGPRAQGELTINGVTKVIAIPYTIQREGNWVTIDGKARVNYFNYNLPEIRSMAVMTVEPWLLVRFHIVGKVK